MNKHKYTANSWQDFSLKKDIEKILAMQKTKETNIDITIISIVISFIAVLVDKYFDMIGDNKCLYFFIVLMLSVFPIIIIIIKWIITCQKRSGLAVHGLPLKQLIDIFDNEVCYYIMMSESFYDLLKEAVDDTDDTDDNMKLFYYTQICFYKNKAIDKLYFMKSKLNAVFDTDYIAVISKKKVAFARLEIVINIINIINKEIESQNALCEKLKKGEMLNKINNKYNEYLQSLKQEIDSVFDVKL